MKIQEVLQVKPPLSALKELVTEYDSLAVVIPEMVTVTRSPPSPPTHTLHSPEFNFLVFLVLILHHADPCFLKDAN
jgi:hypothetical protein